MTDIKLKIDKEFGKHWKKVCNTNTYVDRRIKKIRKDTFKKGVTYGIQLGLEQAKTLVKGLSGRRISHEKLLLLISTLSKEVIK